MDLLSACILVSLLDKNPVDGGRVSGPSALSLCLYYIVLLMLRLHRISLTNPSFSFLPLFCFLVISFMKVFERSACRSIETMVDIFQEYPDEVEYIFKPSCVPLMRCAGCCNDEALECVPTEVYNVTMEVRLWFNSRGDLTMRKSLLACSFTLFSLINSTMNGFYNFGKDQLVVWDHSQLLIYR